MKIHTIIKIALIPSFLYLTSCYSTEPIPTQASEPVLIPRNIQKSVTYGSSTIFLQSRKKGIRANDLMIRDADGSSRFLSSNRFFISDFCVSQNGIVYYGEAGLDYGYEVGTRGHDFTIKKIDLNDKALKPQPILPGKVFTEPKKLAMSHDGRLLCFVTRFGAIHLFDVKNKRKIQPDIGGLDPKKVTGLGLTPDKKSFSLLVNTGVDKTGASIWKKRQLPLPKL